MGVYTYTKLNDVLIGRIQQKHEDNNELSKSALARLFKVSRPSIDKALAYDGSRRPYPRKKRLPTAAVRERRELVKKLATTTVTINGKKYLRCASAQAIAEELVVHYNIKADKSMVWRDTKALGMKCYVRRKVPTRDPDVYYKRLKHANRELRAGKKEITMNRVFSDEHVQPINEFDDRFQYLEQDGTIVPLPREMKNTFNVPCFQVWGAIGYNFKSKLFFFPKTKSEDNVSWRLNSKRYVKQCLSPMIAQLKREGRFDDVTFIQDGARCHTSNWTKDYLAEKKMKYVDEWPPYSPDLNPIENLWANMKIRVSKMRPSTEEELQKCIQKYWDELTLDEINRYCEGYWTKLKGCKANKGCPLTRKFKA